MVSKQLELRDDLEMGDIGIIKDVPADLQGRASDGVFPFHGLQHGLLKQVPPLHRAVWGWRGVRVGELRSLDLSKHEVPADCRTQ